jgi:hypothetical protein
VRAHLTGWALFEDPGLSRVEPSHTPSGDAVAAIRAAADAAGMAGTVWRFVSAATGGRLLCNTSAPWPTPWLS